MLESLIVLIAVAALVFGLIRGMYSGHCRNCRRRVSRDAKVCPFCGNDFAASE